MPTRAFSIEDGNLGVKTIISSQNRTFSDIDLTFEYTSQKGKKHKLDIPLGIEFFWPAAI